MERVIIHVKVQYDRANRTFKLVDHEFKTLLEGDGIYDLSLPVVMYDEADVEEVIGSGNFSIAHA
ncbi:MAG TPA: hypothetical protein VER98_08855 [Terriglobia bacterium]|nr:hypothetical protein [Terriglobia bacterium]